MKTIKVYGGNLGSSSCWALPSINNLEKRLYTKMVPETIPFMAELMEDLSANNILSVSNGSFPARCQLVHLNLNSNQISALEKGSMSNLTCLETLKMNKNKLMEITPLAFHDMHKLRLLELMRNKIKVIKGLTFQGAKKLEILKLKKNNISQLKDGAFYDLQNLKELQLDNNSIVNVTKAWLFGLRKLETLSLSHNKISFIGTEAWEQCKQLVKLAPRYPPHGAYQVQLQLFLLKLPRQEENQVEISSSPAFQCLEELFQEGKLTGTKVAFLKAKFFKNFMKL
ncbi:hypothetical protein Btru_054746 [Bulinus truncatus]|nr:hypothetical protein Btru_054746 [Bulinus truncatus]